MGRFLALAMVPLAALALVASSAMAAPPTRDVSFASFSFEDSSTCPGITIVQSNEERDTIVDFSPTTLWIQRHGVATLTANGKTLTSNFSAMIFIDPTTTVVRVVGTVTTFRCRALATSCWTRATSSSTSPPTDDSSSRRPAPAVLR
jgi:hypothetical protein